MYFSWAGPDESGAPLVCGERRCERQLDVDLRALKPVCSFLPAAALRASGGVEEKSARKIISKSFVLLSAAVFFPLFLFHLTLLKKSLLKTTQSASHVTG